MAERYFIVSAPFSVPSSLRKIAHGGALDRCGGFSSLRGAGVGFESLSRSNYQSIEHSGSRANVTWDQVVPSADIEV